MENSRSGKKGDTFGASNKFGQRDSLGKSGKENQNRQSQDKFGRNKDLFPQDNNKYGR